MERSDLQERWAGRGWTLRPHAAAATENLLSVTLVARCASRPVGIPPACRSGMALELRDDPADDPLSSKGSELLVPILRVDDGKVDPVALATWHQALSNTLAVEVPHDLMGLWLYPAQGGVVLLGPEALAEDELGVPIPDPYLKPEQLSVLEEVVTGAGYGSATCLPVRFGKRDVALLLIA